ncbi:hypothetical protein ACFC1B_07220 [Streptomyces xiamenensis]|uniref:hypothetical protein n=1 Tax=Streptomyces xiamenensis TaxID=408015 RepID=UPI0035D61131
MNTDQPTHDDLRTEAARQLRYMTEDPEGSLVAERMDPEVIPSTAPGSDHPGARPRRWGQLDINVFDAASEGVRDLIGAAADITTWAVALGDDGLHPAPEEITIGAARSPRARIHLAFAADATRAERDELIERLQALVNLP